MAKQRMGTRQRLRVLDESLSARVRRLRERALPILQVGLASGLAYWVAQKTLGHVQPFFAPITVIIILGLSGGDRIKRAVEMSLGCILGVLVGDLLLTFTNIEAGLWQISLVVVIAMAVAALFSPSQLVNNQVAIGAILIITILPPGGETTGIDRTLDSIVGAVIGLATVALIPSAPLQRGRREVGKALEMMSSVLDDVADGLRTKDTELVAEALTAARTTQGTINAMSSAARSGLETAKISPLLWRARRHVKHLERFVNPVDNANRNARVLARRALVLAEDGDAVSDKQLELLDELADISLVLSDVVEGKTGVGEAQEIPELVRRLRIIAAESGVGAAGEQPVLSALVILAQTRSIITDLLQACGMSRESSVAMLAPTSETPAYPPEVWED